MDPPLEFSFFRAFDELAVFSLFLEADSTNSESKGSHKNVVKPEQVAKISPVLLNLLICIY